MPGTSSELRKISGQIPELRFQVLDPLSGSVSRPPFALEAHR